MVKNEGERLTEVVVCTPREEYFRVDDRTVHNITELADRSRAIAQHNRLKALLEKQGARVIDLPELPGHPNSVFTRDTAVCTPEGFLHLRMGLPTRRGEEDWMANALREIGVPEIGRIEPPGTAEGGDIILAGRVVFLGHSGRTNRAGLEQLSRIFQRLGFEPRLAEVPSFSLHIGGAMSLVAPDTVFYCQGTFPEGFFRGFRTIAVPPENFISGNVICLGPGEVIAEAGNRSGIERLETAGIRVHALDLSEFVKGTGGPSCLIMPVSRKEE